MDFALARNIRLPGNRQIQLRLDAFNAFNTVVYTARNSVVTLDSPATNTAATNLPFDAAGNLIATRVPGTGAGFGVVTGSNPARSLQLQLKFIF
jgi:hypothetical protein